DSDGFSIKIGEITCFVGDSCCSDVDFTAESIQCSEVVLKLQSQSSVQAFSSPIKIKRKHDDNVGFSQDQDQNGKKGELLSDLLLPSS
ncbi:hypothetical protein A2U01_0015361, partial [Trifolium medium]|nr:hypothetical protein [Trifolium medium]